MLADEAMKRPDLDRVLGTLKDFQRDTVDHVFKRLYTDPDRANRFLVSDEVGLGKTLVARGVTAKAIDHLWDEVPRIDVVYICSSGDIARQNVNRLNITNREGFALASRVTLLPTLLKDIQRKKLNFISFTPNTSFQLASNAGRADERVLLYWLLEGVWGFRGVAPANVLQGGVRNADRFRWMLDDFHSGTSVDALLRKSFHDAVQARDATDSAAGKPGLRDRFIDLCARFGRARLHIPPADRRDQSRLIGDLRGVLASTCIRALEPDLVILDEFQRFKNLLTVGGEVEAEGADEASLARELFDYSDGKEKTRILLLSATPYKMYTTVDEAGGEDHYADFVETLRFLYDDPALSVRVRETLRQYRRAIQRIGDADSERELAELRASLEGQLRRVMVRTERLASSTDRSGMLREVSCTSTSVDADDALGYRALQRIAKHVEHHDTVEYWKSAPYLLSFMDDYELKRRVVQSIADGDREALKLVNEGKHLFLRPEALRGEEPLGVTHPRLKWLLEATVERGAWRLLWIPPSMPYYRPEGAYAASRIQGLTKHLVFSAWNVVPKAAAALLSLEAERHLFAGLDATAAGLTEIRDRLVPLLRFARDADRLAGMPVLALLYPSIVLADAGDPQLLAEVESGGGPGSRADVVERIQAALTPALARVIERHANPGATADESWYWAAPLLLDAEYSSHLTNGWMERYGLAATWSGQTPDNSEAKGDAEIGPWGEHIARARDLLRGRIKLGPPPSDLIQVLGLIAIAAPGVVALRSLAKVTGGRDRHSEESTRDAAGRIAWRFRNLFNLPESIAVVRAPGTDAPYWRQALEYAADGNIQAVLDEYLHVLVEALGLFAKVATEVVAKLADEVSGAMGLRTAGVGIDELASGADGTPRWGKYRMRARFAVRFGDEEPLDGGVPTRKDAVRAAFNSPFWPFVLITTSVGQEGLDFHLYCHAVVHWNLPSNPVDLEQREGRVHRFKGHAVRKNIALRYADRLGRAPQDPWAAAFGLARSEREPAATDIIPYWVFQTPGGAAIERHVPALPLSRDERRLMSLRQALAVYRMVFGQPRQDELLDYLLARLPEHEVVSRLQELRIDLSPRSSGRSATNGVP